MTDVALVHLLADHEAPLERFLASYDRHPAGVEHDLLFVANGWSLAFAAAARAMIDERAALIEIPDVQLDLETYAAVAGRIPHKTIVFVNSYAEVLRDGWLRLMTEPLGAADIGLVGTTASYESHLSGYLTEAPAAARSSLSVRKVLGGIRSLFALRRDYEPFPNPHLRTGVFAIERQTFLAIGAPRLANKQEAERYESGRRGLTRRVEQLGLRAVVAGGDGVAYDRDRYRDSHTFRIGEQCNLLVADNRTMQYARADAAERQRLRSLAWGHPEDIRCPRCAA